MDTILIFIRKDVNNSLAKTNQLNNRVINEVSDIPELQGLSVSYGNPELKLFTDEEFTALDYSTRLDIRDNYNMAIVKVIMCSEICLN